MSLEPNIAAVALLLNRFIAEACDHGVIVPNGTITVALKFSNTVSGRKKAIAALLHSLWLSELDLSSSNNIKDTLDYCEITSFNNDVEIQNFDDTTTHIEKQLLNTVGFDLFTRKTYSLLPEKAEAFDPLVFDLVINVNSEKMPTILAPTIIIDATKSDYDSMVDTHLSESVLKMLKLETYVQHLLESESFFI